MTDADDLLVVRPADLDAAGQAQVLHDVAVYVAPELGLGGCEDEGGDRGDELVGAGTRDGRAA